jgi:3-hydroxyisobutyrate dehydrogenase-like beta-hydroxyacid dehydrogenase
MPAVRHSEAKPSIGLVGLGRTGGRLAKLLLEAGYQVIGYDRTEAKATWLLDSGLVPAATAGAVADRSQMIFTMVSGPDVLTAVSDGPDGILGGLGPGKTLVELSTVGPLAVQRLAQQVAQTGAAMLDAPVIGTVAALEQGPLRMVLVGGDPRVLGRVRPVLDALSARVVHVGPLGAGALMKLAVNLALPIQWAAFCEGLLLAERGGIARERALEVLGELAAPAVAVRMPLVAELPEEPWFDVIGMQTDLALALERGHSIGVPMLLTAAADQLLTMCRGLGYGRQDLAAMFHVLAELAGGDVWPFRVQAGTRSPSDTADRLPRVAVSDSGP